MVDYFLISYQGVINVGIGQRCNVIRSTEWSTDLTMNDGDVLNIGSFIDFIEEQYNYDMVNIIAINRLTQEEYEFNYL